MVKIKGMRKRSVQNQNDTESRRSGVTLKVEWMVVKPQEDLLSLKSQSFICGRLSCKRTFICR